LVAATFEKAKTYIFAGLVIHNSKVVGSSPTPATISSIDSKTTSTILYSPALLISMTSPLYSVHVGRKLVSETVGATTTLSRQTTYLKSVGSNPVWVRIPPSAPIISMSYEECCSTL